MACSSTTGGFRLFGVEAHSVEGDFFGWKIRKIHGGTWCFEFLKVTQEIVTKRGKSFVWRVLFKRIIFKFLILKLWICFGCISSLLLVWWRRSPSTGNLYGSCKAFSRPLFANKMLVIWVDGTLDTSTLNCTISHMSAGMLAFSWPHGSFLEPFSSESSSTRWAPTSYK